MTTTTPPPSAADRAKEHARNGAAHGGPSTPPKPRGHRAPAIVGTILEHANDPIVVMKLGGVEIVRVRAGGTVIVMGPTGSMKTSLVGGVTAEHARDSGPVIWLSKELPADELGARMIGMQCDAGWLDVLTGKVPRADMERALDLPRMLVLDRRDATLSNLIASIEETKLEFPGQPVVVACDYLQILAESKEREPRAQIADIMAQIDDIARAHLVVVIAISQMSRASSRAARAGEAVGADSTDGGAESAAIERYATATLSIGASGPVREDGTRPVDLSIGKGRMSGGDKVIPMSACGRSGRWRVAGDARPAAEVKAERSTARDAGKVDLLVHGIPGKLDESPEPLTRQQLRAALGARDEHVRAAVESLLGDPDGVVVEVGPRRGGAYRLWTLRRAEVAGSAIVRRNPRNADA